MSWLLFIQCNVVFYGLFLVGYAVLYVVDLVDCYFFNSRLNTYINRLADEMED